MRLLQKWIAFSYFYILIFSKSLAIFMKNLAQQHSTRLLSFSVSLFFSLLDSSDLFKTDVEIKPPNRRKLRHFIFSQLPFEEENWRCRVCWIFFFSSAKWLVFVFFDGNSSNLFLVIKAAKMDKERVCDLDLKVGKRDVKV